MAISPYTVKKLLTLALRNDPEALAELIKINRMISKVANVRLSNLEKKAFDFYAYDKAETYIKSIGNYNKSGKPRYPEGKMGAKLGNKQSIRDLEKNIQSALEFNTSPTSTITGHKEAQKSRIKSFEDRGIHIPKEDRNAFLRFMGTDSVKSIMRDFNLSSDQVIDIIRGARDDGASYQAIKNAFDSMKRGEKISVDEAIGRLKDTLVAPDPTDYDSSEEYLEAVKNFKAHNNGATFYQKKNGRRK